MTKCITSEELTGRANRFGRLKFSPHAGLSCRLRRRLKQSHGLFQKSPLHVDFQEQLSNLTLFVAVTDKPGSSLFWRHAYFIMFLLCSYVVLSTIKKWNIIVSFFFAFAWTCYSTIKTFCYLKNVCHGLFVDKTCVRDFLSGNPLSTDTPIIRIFCQQNRPGQLQLG